MINIQKAITLCSLLGAVAAEGAATVAFNNLVGNSPTLSGYTITIDDTGTSLLYNFTFTGDIDGCAAAGVAGAADDTFSFTLVENAYTGSTFSGDTATAGVLSLGTAVDDNLESTNVGAIHFGFNDALSASNPYLDTGYTFELGMTNVSYSRGEASVAETVTFNGFTSIQAFTNADTEILLGTSGTSQSVSQSNQVALGGVQDLTITQTGASNHVRFRNLDFSFDLEDSHDQVPEPSSTILAGLSALGLLVRRRR